MRKLETIFGELLKLVPRYQFDKAVEQYQGDRYVKSYTTWHQYITILFSQIKQKDSIRDIVTGWDAFESYPLSGLVIRVGPNQGLETKRERSKNSPN